MITARKLSTDPLAGGPCFCCRRRDDGAAFTCKPGYFERRPLVWWSCDDHIHLARKAFLMPKKELDRAEQEALRDAGDAGGSYLDDIGETDLAKLGAVEWIGFLRKIIDTFGKSLADRLDKAP